MEDKSLIALLQVKQFVSTIDYVLEKTTMYPFQQVVLEAERKSLKKGLVSLLKKLKLAEYRSCQEEIEFDDNIDMIFKRLDSFVAHQEDLILENPNEADVYLREELDFLIASIVDLKNHFN